MLLLNKLKIIVSKKRAGCFMQVSVSHRSKAERETANPSEYRQRQRSKRSTERSTEWSAHRLRLRYARRLALRLRPSSLAFDTTCTRHDSVMPISSDVSGKGQRPRPPWHTSNGPEPDGETPIKTLCSCRYADEASLRNTETEIIKTR